MGTDPWRLSTGGCCYLAPPGTLLGGNNRLGGHSLRVTVPVSGRFWSFQTRSKKEARTTGIYDPSGDQHLIGSRDVLLGDLFARSR